MTTTPPRTHTERGLRTRGKLLAAAEEVFLAHGFHDASVVKITERAGVSQGTFYLYFASKQRLFDELVTDLNRRVRHAMSDGAARGRTRVESELLGFEAFFRFTADHPALYRVIRQAELVSPEAQHLHYSRILDGYVQALTAAREAGEIGDLDPEVTAWALMGIGEIIGMRWVLWEGRRQVPPEVIAEVGRLIGRLLAPAPDGGA
ncbi:MAG: TetR/AcrR family transcriptional regulator [Jatrophihabitans sp.]|nr:MAG: TetR/AcrR family transcriptional regulator [Jatrophihabitans sp.]